MSGTRTYLDWNATAPLRGEARAGKLDADAVTAVLAAAGHVVPKRREFAAGLSVLEIDLVFDIAHTPRVIIEAALKEWRERRHRGA